MTRPRPPPILRRSVLRLAASLLLPAGAPVRAQDTALASAVKAAYIPKFVPFVAWPGEALYDPAGAVSICVVGADPFGDLLDRVIAGQTIAGHPIVVHRLRTVSRTGDCQILFAGGSADQPVADILAAVRGTPVLTMTDDAHDPQSRGIINFIISGNRVRFEIDQDAAAANGLSVSSKLLSLATRVLGRG